MLSDTEKAFAKALNQMKPKEKNKRSFSLWEKMVRKSAEILGKTTKFSEDFYHEFQCKSYGDKP